MEQETVAVDTQVLYPVLLLPGKCTTAQTKCSIIEKGFVNVTISSVGMEGHSMCIYSGYCNVELVDYGTNKSETLDFNQVPTIIETPMEKESQVWIDPERSPEVFNHNKAMETLQNYRINHQARASQTTVETYVTQNVDNHEESIHYSPAGEHGHKKLKNIDLNEQQAALNTSFEQLEFNLYEDNEFECGVFLSQLSEDIINENENRARDERRFNEMPSQNDALKQLMSPDIQSLSKQTKTILFLGHDVSHGQTIQKIGVNDPTMECSVSQYHGDQDYDSANVDPNRKKYQCEKCKRIFYKLYDFKKHMVGSHRPIPRGSGFTCAECGKTLKSQEKLAEHSARHGDPNLECNKCRKVFASKATLRTHAETHTRKCPCTMCFKSFTTNHNLNLHMMKCHSLMQCDKCVDLFNNFEDLEQHRLSHQEKQQLADTSETELADGSFMDADIANKDSMIATDNIPVEEKFEEKSGDQGQEKDGDDDLKNADLVIAKVMSCDIFLPCCKKLKPNGKVDKTCKVCDKTFDRIGDLKRHLIEHVLRSTLAKSPVSKDSTLAIQCEVCKVETFTEINKYKAHLRKHAKLTLYQCTFCDKSFSDSSNFSKHKKVHGVSYFQCDLCQRRLLTKKMLTQHIEHHNRNPPVTCDYCKKIFDSKSKLTKHIKTLHIKKAPHRFRCRFCQKYFCSLKNTWDHEWAVHNVRKIVVDCIHCRARFRKYSQLKRHCADKHDVQLPHKQAAEFQNELPSPCLDQKVK